MALNKNSTTYVVGFVFVITCICAFIIATAATVLKPAQVEQKEANIQKNVLKVAKVAVEPKQKLSNVFAKNIEVAYVNIETGLPVATKDLPFKESDYDQILTSSKFKKYVTKLSSNQNLPGLKDNLISKYQKIYIHKDGKGFSEVILPFYGNGLWSVMYGLLAVAPDGNSVTGITYYEQGETPGLGGEVENPNFTKQFPGRVIYQGQVGSTPKLQLVKAPKGPSEVNALTGATLTSGGVNNQLLFWLGEFGYAKFLSNLHACNAVDKNIFVNATCAKGGQ